MRQLAWAMVRLDNYLEHLFRDREKSESPVATLVAVVGISLSREFGDQEVRRLSALRADDGCTYALKETTFFWGSITGSQGTAGDIGQTR